MRLKQLINFEAVGEEATADKDTEAAREPE